MVLLSVEPCRICMIEYFWDTWLITWILEYGQYLIFPTVVLLLGSRCF